MTEQQPQIELGWPEIAAIIFTSQGITTGLWRLGVKIRFVATVMQMVEDNNGTISEVSLPTSMSAIEAIAITPAQQPGPMIFDAAELLSLASRKDKSKTRARPATVTTPSTTKRIAKSEPKPVAKTKRTVKAK